MTPRTVVVALQQDMTISDALQVRPDTSFSRLPIYATTLDTVSGFVLREDLLIAQTQGTGSRAVAELRRDILTVAGPTPLTTLLEQLLARRHHIAIVIGEYGEIRGVVTLEDVVETLLGIEIVDEGDRVEDLQAAARQLWRKRAQVAGLEIEVVDPKPSDEASTQPPTGR
jgi:CBS domain containing-hemolysin-like protein